MYFFIQKEKEKSNKVSTQVKKKKWKQDVFNKIVILSPKSNDKRNNCDQTDKIN